MEEFEVVHEHLMKLAELVQEAADVVVHSVELVVAEVEAVQAEVVVELVCFVLEEEKEVDKQLANELQEPRVKSSQTENLGWCLSRL